MAGTILVYVTVDCGSIRHKQAVRRETIFRDTDVSARWGPRSLAENASCVTVDVGAVSGAEVKLRVGTGL